MNNNSQSGNATSSNTRRYDNDWLTVLAMLTIFLFHCARFFNFEDWHVKNDILNEGMSYFVSIVGQWIMPLFFLLSGISSYYSLRSRSSRAYVQNRFRRLVVPFLFGTFVVLIPVQVWIERVTHGAFAGSFLSFYPEYFKGFYAFGGNFAWMGLHLWYLEFLFLFTILTLPLFILFKSDPVLKKTEKLHRLTDKPGTIFLLGIPVFVMELIVNTQPEGIGIRVFGGWSLLTYLVVFVTGFWIAVDSGYRESIERHRYVSLLLGVALTMLNFFFPINLSPLGEFAEYTISLLSRSYNSLFWLVAILGFGSKHLTANPPFLKYAREAVLPFYILHQTIIVVFGFYIVNWETGVVVKYPVLCLGSFVLILFFYHLLIKRFHPSRYLFGMKTRR